MHFTLKIKIKNPLSRNCNTRNTFQDVKQHVKREEPITLKAFLYTFWLTFNIHVSLLRIHSFFLFISIIIILFLVCGDHEFTPRYSSPYLISNFLLLTNCTALIDLRDRRMWLIWIHFSTFLFRRQFCWERTVPCIFLAKIICFCHMQNIYFSYYIYISYF